jgi:hypothetical protein
MKRALVVVALLLPGVAQAAPSIRDGSGAGVFGRWSVDRFGLPAYDYTLDQRSDRRAARVELSGRKEAWHQVGNDAIVADAFTDGYTQLFSQQRMYQWANKWDAANRHYSGGFGWLAEGGHAQSTLWLDHPKGAPTLRRFGIGYSEHRLQTNDISIAETVTAPFGDDPVLVHEVRLRNRSARTRALTWWEYWDVNPFDQTTKIPRGLDSPRYADGRLSARQTGDVIDIDPLTIFLAPVDTPVAGYEADTQAFFGNGTRALPAAVAADRATGSRAPATLTAFAGRAMFALRTPVTLRAGEGVTLRYVYGMAHPRQIDGIVRRTREQPSTNRATAAKWHAWLPQSDFGRARRWLSRELQWSAYMVRSSSMYEETCGHHIITQGGYYQYGMGQQIAFRDPLQHMLPMVYAEPELAREVLRYSFAEQPPQLGVIPYGMLPLCLRLDFGASDDLDFWLLLSTIEYVLGTRDTDFLRERIPYDGGLPGPALASGTVWEHVKLAVRHQEQVIGRGPNGQYIIGPTGDWSDLSPLFLGITESTLVTAQMAYAYPRLAEVAELVGDTAFAAQLRELGRGLQQTLRKEWVSRGWFARGYSALTQLGKGAIFGEPQPWALLGGAAQGDQRDALVRNVQRFLVGRGAPASLHGPSKIGASTSPSEEDPDVDEHAIVYADGVGDKNAVFVGGAWYAINGPLVWALGQLDGIVPGAANDAFDELQRNTLRAHAVAYPEDWDGVINVDDACWSWYSTQPGRCGINLLITLNQTAGQVTHQPAWSLFSMLKLAGVEPTREGYRIAPHLPLPRWSLKLPLVGVTQERNGRLSGYVRPERSGPVTFEIVPRGGRVVRFTKIARAGRALRWAVPAR